MITFISIVILFLLILFTGFISYKRDKELEKRIFELELDNSELKRKNSELKWRMDNFLL